MDIRLLTAPALLATLIGAGPAFAQNPARVTDVGPPPAEERDSAGAIVLEDSMVRAQREKAFAEASGRTGVVSVGQRLVRTRSQARSEAASARADDTAELVRRGAGSLTGK